MIEIRWATEQKVMAVSSEVPLSHHVTDILDDWRTVAVVVAPGGNQRGLLGLHLGGVQRSTGRTICTSPVVSSTSFQATQGRSAARSICSPTKPMARCPSGLPSDWFAISCSGDGGAYGFALGRLPTKAVDGL